MFRIRQSEVYSDWLRKLRDRTAKANIAMRTQRLAAGNAGDVKAVGEGVCELRIDFGPGYRVYFIQKGKVLIVLLCGGDKNSQAADIKKAKTLAAQLKEED